MKRKSRFDRSPVTKDGKPAIVYPNKSDLKLFQLLNRYRYLPTDFLLALTGTSYDYLGRRLEELYSEPNCFVDRPRAQLRQPFPLSRYLIHELDVKGERALKDAALWSDEPAFGDKNLFAHSLMVTETIASLEIGGASMIWFPEISSRLTNPERFIPVNITHGKNTAKFDYYNDSNGPFGIRYPDGTARFFSLEAEHANQVDCPNLKKTSFLKKFLAIRDLMERQAYKTAWGIPNLIHLVVTSSQARIDTMKALILRETDNKGCAYIAFYKIPVLESMEAAKPLPEMFTGGWQRAGLPDFFLNQPKAR